MSQDPGDLGGERGLPGVGGDGCEGDPSLPRGMAGALCCGCSLPQPKARKSRRGAVTAHEAHPKQALVRERHLGSLSLAAAVAAAAAAAAWEALG